MQQKYFQFGGIVFFYNLSFAFVFPNWLNKVMNRTNDFLPSSLKFKLFLVILISLYIYSCYCYYYGVMCTVAMSKIFLGSFPFNLISARTHACTAPSPTNIFAWLFYVLRPNIHFGLDKTVTQQSTFMWIHLAVTFIFRKIFLLCEWRKRE